MITCAASSMKVTKCYPARMKRGSSGKSGSIVGGNPASGPCPPRSPDSGQSGLPHRPPPAAVRRFRASRLQSRSARLSDRRPADDRREQAIGTGNPRRSTLSPCPTTAGGRRGRGILMPARYPNRCPGRGRAPTRRSTGSCAGGGGTCAPGSRRGSGSSCTSGRLASTWPRPVTAGLSCARPVCEPVSSMCTPAPEGRYSIAGAGAPATAGPPGLRRRKISGTDASVSQNISMKSST